MEGGLPITYSTRFLTSKLRFFPQALTSLSLIAQRGIKSEHVCQSNIHVKFTRVSKMMSSSVMIKVFKCGRVKLVRKCKESQRSPLFFFLSLLQAVLLPFHKHSWKHIPEGIKLSSWLHTHRNTHTQFLMEASKANGWAENIQICEGTRWTCLMSPSLVLKALKHTRRQCGTCVCVCVCDCIQLNEARGVFNSTVRSRPAGWASVCLSVNKNERLCDCEVCLYAVLFLMWCQTRSLLFISFLIMSSMIFTSITCSLSYPWTAAQQRMRGRGTE